MFQQGIGLSGKLLQIIAVPGVIIIFAIVAAAATTIPKPADCPSKCGDVEIPFPFGFAKGCYLDESFNITCDSGKPKTGNVTVTNISIDTHELHVLTDVAQDCYQKVNETGARNSNAKCFQYGGKQDRRKLIGEPGTSGSGYRSKPALVCVPTVRVHGRRYKNKPEFRVSQYTISNSKNKFTVIGCDTIAYLSGFQNGEWYNIGCASQCPTLNNVVNGSCSGVGCCELGFPDGLKNISVEVFSFKNHSHVWDFNPCGYAFVVEKGQFNFTTDHLKNYTNQTVPLVLDWAVSNLTCEEARNKPNFACKDINSTCTDLQTRQGGYRCQCKQGYKGNPYRNQGCQDIDECSDRTHNCTKHCFNTQGNYTCGCPKWYRGDGRKDGEGCSVDLALAFKVSIGIGIGLIGMLGGSSWLFLVFQKRKFIKLNAKLFQQNGGLILKRRLQELGSPKKAKIYASEELRVATKNYKKSMIIGEGSFGTVYKGFLPNNTIVAIKKSKTVDPDQVDQFINEIVLLSQIDHKNVVKLLGCCLETQVPLLVYEFVSQGTLFNYIHCECTTSTKRWEIYLKIVAETAGALSYLHSTALPPIIHRDVKPSNILLDDNFTVKVSDFGTSKLVLHDRKDVATVMQGTFGYLDPEFLQTSQLTEKSDVYSFGVVLVELLTGDEVFSDDRSDDNRCLPIHFLSLLKDDRMDEILDKRIVEEGNKEQIKELVKLAERCLRVKGDERPSMKELAMELEQIKKMETHLWVNAQSNLEKAEHLDGMTSNAYENGGSSSSTAG